MSGRKPQEERLFDSKSRWQRRGTRSRAVGTTVQALRDLGALERVDEVLVDGARGTAQLVDAVLADPDQNVFGVRAAWAEHREWVRDLLSRTTSDHGPHPLDELLAALDDTPQP